MIKEDRPTAVSHRALRHLQQALSSGQTDPVDRAYLLVLRERLERVRRRGGDYQYLALSNEASQLIEPNRTVITGMESGETVQPCSKTLLS